MYSYDYGEIRGGKGNPTVAFYFDNVKGNYSIQELLDTISTFGSQTACSAEEAGKAFRRLSTAIMEANDLGRPETHDQTAIPNEEEPFDFLEQNVYDTDLLLNFPEDDGNQFITPLDSY